MGYNRNIRLRRRFQREIATLEAMTPSIQDLGNIRRYAREIKAILNKQENQIAMTRQLLNSIVRLSHGTSIEGEL